MPARFPVLNGWAGQVASTSEYRWKSYSKCSRWVSWGIVGRVCLALETIMDAGDHRFTWDTPKGYLNFMEGRDTKHSCSMKFKNQWIRGRSSKNVDLPLKMSSWTYFFPCLKTSSSQPPVTTKNKVAEVFMVDRGSMIFINYFNHYYTYIYKQCIYYTYIFETKRSRSLSRKNNKKNIEKLVKSD